MVSIFISHAKDHARTARLAEALTTSGYDVWWDEDLEGGAVYAKVIAQKLEEADRIIVAWSERSIDSDWVKDEAAVAASQHKLVPIFFDAVTPPLGFGQYHSVDFTQWSGQTDDAAFGQLQRAIDRDPSGKSKSTIAPTGRRKQAFWRPAIAALLVAAIVATIWLYQTDSILPEASTASVTGARSIAVLPFTNLSADPDQSYFSDGIAEEIIHLLAQVDGLRVSARTSAFLFRDANVDVPEVGRALGVQTVLAGSVRREGDHVRITAQLIDATTGFHVWSKTFDRQLGSVLAIQSEVAQQVLHSLTLEADGLVQPASTPSVYEDYLRARALLSTESSASLREAAQLLDALAERAPEDGRVHAARAQAWILLSDEQYGEIPVADALASAQPHIDAALRLAPLDATSHTVLGLSLLFERRFDESVVALEQATALAPGDALPWHWLYFAHKEAGGWLKGREALARAAELDPLYPPTFGHWSYILGEARPDLTQAMIERYESQWPDDPKLLSARNNYHFARGELAEAHRNAMAYCDRVGLQKTLCTTMQIDNYYVLNLPEGMAAMGAAPARAPLLDAFMCPVDALRPIGALAQFRSTQFSTAFDDWRGQFNSDASQGMDPTTGAVYAASHQRWEDVRKLLEPLAAYPNTVLADLVSLHPAHIRFYAADLALARKMTGDSAGAERLLGDLRQLRGELDEMRRSRLAPDKFDALLGMAIAAVEGDAETAFADYSRAYELGYRYRSPLTEPLLLQWRDDQRFRQLQSRYDADIALEREIVLAQLTGRSFIAAQAIVR